MQLTITTFMTLDGVVQAPGAPDEDRSGGFGQGGWLVHYADNDVGQLMSDYFTRASVFLLGRRTYEIFAAHWPHVSDDNPIAAALNHLPKYVVTTTLEAPAWPGSTPIGPADIVEEIAELKAQPGNELQVHGSGQLIGTLMAHNQIDEYRLLIYPVVLGTGRRLFEDPRMAAALQLVDTRTTGAGVVVLTYHPGGDPRHGSFASVPEPDAHRILR